ncbi:MAG: hypothetical protein KGN02_07455 [bacterium]|nr:hypothetical protein [bacterium]
MTQSVRDLEGTFARSWVLLRRNWIIVVPGLVLGVLGAAAQYAVSVLLATTFVVSGNGSDDALYASMAVTQIASTVIATGFALVQLAYITGMAGACWQRGSTTLRDGWSALAHRVLPMIGAWLLLEVLAICAAFLAPVTFYVTVIIYAVFLIYTVASVIIGERGPIGAIAESSGIAFGNLGPSLGVVGLILAIAIVGAILGSFVARVSPVAASLVAGVLEQVIVAYASLVVVGEYLKLTNRPTAS